MDNRRSDQIKYEVVNLEKQIGNTPLVNLSRLVTNPQVTIMAKQEWQQLGGSIKARPAFNIIKQAIFGGQLQPGQHLLDASSGNTGIAYAIIGEALNIPVTICLPQNASAERINILKKHGAEIIFTSSFGSTDEAQEKAQMLSGQFPDKYFYADQYANENNWRAHYQSTANEILKQSDNRLTHFVCGLGTTGTFVGTGRRLKEKNSSVTLVSLQPELALHGLEGWKHLPTATVPSIYDSTIADFSLEVSTESAYEMIKNVYAAYGYKISPSSAANLVGSILVAESITSGVIVTMFPDNADNYGDVMKQIFNKGEYEVNN
jgi:cysteine synthase B